jgi:hypothetical protein
MPYITVAGDSISSEHMCCAFSDKKCAEGYELKKQWLAEEFGKGYVFRRLDERAKVFIEYGPAESAWVPVTAPGDDLRSVLGRRVRDDRHQRLHDQPLRQDSRAAIGPRRLTP